MTHFHADRFRRAWTRQATEAHAKDTQQGLAEALGVSESYVSRLLNGERTPSLAVALRAARLVGLPLEQLVE